MEWNALATSLVAFLIAAGSPGPATLSAAYTALAHGKRAGLAHGMGLSLGLFVWGVVAALGVGSLIIQVAPALIALKIAGGLYLLWLAYKSCRSALTTQAKATTGAETLHGATGHFRGGLILNLSNPKAIFAWLSVIAIGLPAAPASSLVFTVTAACGALGVIIYAAIALIFSRPRAMTAYAKAQRWIDGMFAALFAAAGLKLLTWKAAL